MSELGGLPWPLPPEVRQGGFHGGDQPAPECRIADASGIRDDLGKGIPCAALRVCFWADVTCFARCTRPFVPHRPRNRGEVPLHPSVDRAAPCSRSEVHHDVRIALEAGPVVHPFRDCNDMLACPDEGLEGCSHLLLGEWKAVPHVRPSRHPKCGALRHALDDNRLNLPQAVSLISRDPVPPIDENGRPVHHGHGDRWEWWRRFSVPLRVRSKGLRVVR